MPHKLLLADDSVTIQRVIELTFADEDVQVIAVGNGQQAIECVEKDLPDIVLADIGMPERDGYEVAAFIKGNPAFAHIPVVLLTGAFEPIDETRARAVGCDGVLVKPFEPQMVISRVKDLLAGRRPEGLWGSGPAAQGPVRQAAGDLALRSPAAPAGGDPLEAYFDRLDAAFSTIGEGAPAQAGTPAPGQAQAFREQEQVRPAPREPIPLSRPASAGPQTPGYGATSSPGGAQGAHMPGFGAPPPAAPAPAPPRAAVGDLGAWDPDLVGDPARPAPIDAPFAFAPEPAAPAAPPARAWASTPPPVPPAAAIAPPSLVDAFAALLAAEQRTAIAPSAAPETRQASVDDALIDAVTQRVLARLNDETVRPAVLEIAERLVRDEIERIKKIG